MTGRPLIVAGVRTPIGAMSGALASVPAPELGAACVRALLERTGVGGEKIDEVIMGNVISAGIGQNPARQAALFGGLPPSVGAVTVNKVCGSGLKAVTLADQAVRLERRRVDRRRRHGKHDSSTLSRDQGPRGLPTRSRRAVRRHDSRRALGCLWSETHGELRGSLRSNLQDRPSRAGRLRGAELYACPAGDCARDVQGRDRSGRTFRSGGSPRRVAVDEGPARFDEPKLRSLKPAFGTDGTITAGNASSIGDGAAALLVASARVCGQLKLQAAGRDRRFCHVQPAARVVYDGTRRRHSQAARPARLDRRPGRSLRDQRGVRSGHHVRGA